MIRPFHRLPTICLISLVIVPIARSEDVLLEQATRGNQSTIEAIRTLYAKVDLKVTPAGQQTPSLAFSGEYWKEPSLVRVRESCRVGRAGEILDYLAKDGMQRTITRTPGPQPNTFAMSLLVAKEHRRTILTDAWKLALLYVPTATSADKPAITLAEARQRLTFKQSVREKGPTGLLVRLSFYDDSGAYDVWIDPGVNWLIRRAVRRIRGGAGRQESTKEYVIKDFAEVQPGVFFPARMTMIDDVAADNGIDVTYEATLSDIAINTLVAPPFPTQLDFQKGMPATDEVAGTRYLVDSNGIPASTFDVLRYAPPTLAPPIADPSAAHDWNWLKRPSTYLLVLSFGFGVAAAILAVRRRRREEG